MKIVPMSATYIDHMGSDLSVVNAARVSFHKESHLEAFYACEADKEDDIYSYKISKGDEKLIQYLAKHKHFSPFNHSFLSFRIKAPIFVARQLVKHKFMPWNEVSRRYVDEEPEFYLPDGFRSRAENVKQGSGEIIPEGEIIHEARIATLRGLSTYLSLLQQGVAPEQARMVLPQNMMTEWIWSGTLGAYADMLRLRLDPHTQAESREVAQMIYKEVERLFPVSIKALLNG